MLALSQLGPQYMDSYSNRIVQTGKTKMMQMYNQSCQKENQIRHRKCIVNVVQKECQQYLTKDKNFNDIRKLKILRMQQDLCPSSEEIENIKEELESEMKLDKIFMQQTQREQIEKRHK
jgi:hypothetical protein